MATTTFLHVDPLSFDRPMSVQEARRVRLNWKIEAKPVFCELEEDSDGYCVLLPIPKSVALIRSDTREVLGLVSPSYQIVQPSDFWDILDRICGRTGATVVSAGEMDGSKLQYAAVEVGEPYESLGIEYRQRVSIVSGADGRTKLLPIASTTSPETIIVSTAKENCRYSPVKHSGDLSVKVEDLVNGAQQAVNRVKLHKQRLLEWEGRRVKSFAVFRTFLRKHVFGLGGDFLSKENSSSILGHFETIEDLVHRRAEKVGCRPENMQNVFLATNFFFDHFLGKSDKVISQMADDVKLRQRISGPVYDKKVKTFMAFVHEGGELSLA